MLSIGKLTAGSESYYLDLANGGDDYYLRPGELAGRWAGSLAPLLGLDGTVDPEHFRAVLAGRHPTGGWDLSGRPEDPRRVTGFDLTFSAPKSVSLLWALSDSDTANAVAQAHDDAVADAIEALEAEAVRARRGHAGAEMVATGGMVAAAFGHRTSRAGDPQLHSHVVAANLTLANDGKWSALYGQRIYAWAKTTGYLYQAALRHHLTETLGVEWGPVQRGVAEIAGVSAEQIAEFSTRRAQIAAELERLGLDSAASKRTATLTTRPAKDHDADLQQLHADWQERAETVGLDTGQLTRPARPTDVADLADELLAPSGLTANASSFDRRDLLQALAAAQPDGAPPHLLRREADRILADERVVPLATAPPAAGRRYSTIELLAIEDRLVTGAAGRQGEGTATAHQSAVDAALDDRPTLSPEQRHLVEQLTRSGNGVDVLIGRAGTGKTFALDAARAAWEASGYRVIGTALAARAAAELQAGAGITSQTVDRLLADLDTPGPLSGLAPGTVVVVDEAGMVGTRKLDRLLAHAEHWHAKVVLVGDPRQLPEIEAGGALAALGRRIAPIELVINRRQIQEWERDALALLRVGAVEKAVTAYLEHGRITLTPDADTARAKLVDDWWQARQDGADVGMYALRRSDVDDLNDRARQHMRDAGSLTGSDVHVAGRDFAPGDIVLCLRNDRRIGVRNGTVATLQQIDADAAVITTADGQTVTIGADYLAAGHLSHGYATTIHKAQGATVDQAFLLGSDQLYREAGYVGLSRARTATNLYLVGPTLQPTHDLDPDTLDELTRSLGASRAQTVGIDQLPGATDVQPLDARRALAAALLADPPLWAVDLLGPPPTGGFERDRWRDDATRIANYRDRYHHHDPTDALGPRPDDDRQRRDWHLARLAADRHRDLGQERGLSL